MKRITESAWEIIGHDPLLRLELTEIECHSFSGDEIVVELMEFFARIDRYSSEPVEAW